MGELARRRRARDLWISRGHVWAIGVGVVLVGIIAFSLGATLNRGGEAALPADAALASADESLVDLLARVDARAVAQDGVDTLTFPDTLSGVAAEPAIPATPTADRHASEIAPGAVGLRPFDAIIPTEDDIQAAILSAALVGGGFRARVESDDQGARVVVDGGADLVTARETEAGLRARLTELGHDSEVVLRAR